MTIETKYNIGERVYFMHNNKVDNACISDIDVLIRYDRNHIRSNPDVSIYYYIDSRKYSELNLFPTKEELIKSL